MKQGLIGRLVSPRPSYSSPALSGYSSPWSQAPHNYGPAVASSTSTTALAPDSPASGGIKPGFLSALSANSSGKFRDNASFGSVYGPGYDDDGQRSWDAGAEGYTPISVAQAGPDNRMARDFMLEK